MYASHQCHCANVSKCKILLGFLIEVAERDGQDRERGWKKKADRLKLMTEKLKSWKGQETKPRPLNRQCGPFTVFRSDVSRQPYSFNSYVVDVNAQ